VTVESTLVTFKGLRWRFGKQFGDFFFFFAELNEKINIIFLYV